jgi:hypothetical protein
MPEIKSVKSLYAYLDEAGNYDFSERGSKFFIMTCAIMRRPFTDTHKEMLELKYDCLESGLDLDRFHASDDVQNTRDRFYAILTEHSDDYDVYSIAIEKSLLAEEYHNPTHLYASAFKLLSDYIIELDLTAYDQLIVITDAIPTNAKLNHLKAPLKSSLKSVLAGSNTEFALYHHASASDLNLQVVDYFCWAIQRYLERDDDRSLVLIKDSLKGIWRVKGNGDDNPDDEATAE